jgi:hypothetical protein
MAIERSVLAAIRKKTDRQLGLAFVPDVVRNLPRPAETKKVLVELAQAGKVELRPDGGLGRFKQVELDNAPDGPQGSKLMWARLLP